MVDLIIIVISILMFIFSAKLFLKYQTKKISKKIYNLQEKSEEKLAKLLAVESLFSTQYAEEIINSIADGVVVTNKEKILYASPAFLKITGYTSKEIVDKPWDDLVYKNPTNNHDSNINHLIKINNAFHFFNNWKCKNGKIKTLWWTSTPYNENGICYSVCRDISNTNLEKSKVNNIIDELLEIEYKNNINVILNKLYNNSTNNYNTSEVKNGKQQ